MLVKHIYEIGKRVVIIVRLGRTVVKLSPHLGGVAGTSPEKVGYTFSGQETHSPKVIGVLN